MIKLLSFLEETQPRAVEQLAIREDSPKRQKFLARLQGEITKRGVIDVLRHGIKHGPRTSICSTAPSPGNAKAEERYAQNRFSVTRQLRYSRDETQLRARPAALFINGLPIATFELKNSLTKQTVEDAVEQYKRDRDPRELLFEFGRCVVHFAVDDHEVRLCTQLQGQGFVVPAVQPGLERRRGQPAQPGRPEDGLPLEANPHAGGPDRHPRELRADRRERRIRRPARRSAEQIFPRYHQLDVVRKLLADAEQHGAGKRYLIQHSAGSGKVELHRVAGAPAHRLEAGRQGGLRLDHRRHRPAHPRRADSGHDQAVRPGGRDGGPRRAFRRPAQVHRERQEDHHLDGAEVPVHPGRNRDEHAARRFAIIIDEAHSSQGGQDLGGHEQGASEAGAEEDDETTEDTINRIMEARKMLPNASYFAFTATPKNKTLEMFGEAYRRATARSSTGPSTATR